jgi:cystatin-A/B
LEVASVISNKNSHLSKISIQVDVGGGKFVHLRVYQPLPHTGKPAELSDMQLNKTADDEITYF